MRSKDQNGLIVRSAGTLQGQVAQILNEREIVINAGSERGVRVGMKFAVLADKPTDIYDPDSGELLDKVDREKTRVEATEVREKIAICRTYRTRVIDGGPLYQSFGSNMFAAPKEIVETLKIGDASPLPPLSPAESYVKIKDRVVQVS